jgi:methionine sulfoxide reductase heme-binding subunit
MREAVALTLTQRLVRSVKSPDTIRRAIYVVGAIPAAWVFYKGFNDQLGADPVRALEKQLGIWGLRFLVIGLAVTPLRRIGGPNLIRYRRAIGLLAFFYAALHLFAYLWFDQNLDLSAIGRDILKRPYVTVGFASFLILLPLAITSTNAMIRRLGSRWNQLHKLVYLASALAAAHFIMLVKRWPPEPLIYAGLIAALLGFRLVVWARKRNAPPRSR